MHSPNQGLFTTVALTACSLFLTLPAISTPASASENVSIAAIQGSGEKSPLTGQTVTTRGVVTAVYPEGGLKGYFIQTEGSGPEAKTPGTSDGIFVYSPQTVSQVSTGQFLEVTGKVSEYFGQTQLTVSRASGLSVLAEPFRPVSPITDPLPETAEEREALEGMLLLPGGEITVTDNYSTNRYGEIGLVNGSEPLRTATDVVAPGAEAQRYEEENSARAFILDDGATTDYTRSNQDVPLPYLGGDTPLRVGAQLTFKQPVVLGYSHGSWRLQPTSQVTGATDPAALPATWTNTRSEAPKLVSQHTASSFNVLNYFTTVGDTVAGCKFYTDRDKNPITVSGGCAVRGAATLASFERQESKIVRAINSIDTSVLSLEEIENSLATGGSDRDAALNTLVAALNQDAGYDKWASVPSPQKLPAREDVIRTAFIYQPAEVKPVGSSEILDDPAFSNARQPLAQVFVPANSPAQSGEGVFLAIVNHFKSKGSGSGANADQGDGQGASNASRVAQSQALARFAQRKQQEVGTPNVLLLGDFNSYGQEDPLQVLYEEGYTNIGDTFDAGHTYLYGGRSGSLDHILASPALAEKVQEAQVWNINSVEPVAREYSRYNYNVTNLYEDNEYRSSDHDPLLVGMDLVPERIEFTDVPQDSMFYREIMWLAQERITTGWAEADGSRTYRPLQDIERGAVAAYFYRLAGSPQVNLPASPSFSDVPASHPFYREIEWMKEASITTGWDDGSFRPHQPVKRDAMAAFFYRYAGNPSYQPTQSNRFTDVDPAHPFYKEIMWLRSTGITTGWDDGSFRPHQPIKRDAMAAFIYHYVTYRFTGEVEH